MILWCVVLLVLGSFNILDDIGAFGNIGHTSRLTTSALILVVIGILFRIRHKEQFAEKEKLREKLAELERKLREIASR